MISEFQIEDHKRYQSQMMLWLKSLLKKEKSFGNIHKHTGMHTNLSQILKWLK